MTFGSVVSRLGAPIIALSLTFAAPFAAAHAAENARKVTDVSFGLFGDQGVFRSEATGAAQIVASRFGGSPVVIRFNTKTGGDATVETLAATLRAEAKKMNGESDILFVILTSHGSRDGLAVTAGRRLAETLKPSKLAERRCLFQCCAAPGQDSERRLSCRALAGLEAKNCARASTRRTRKWQEAQTWSPCSSPARDGPRAAKPLEDVAAGGLASCRAPPTRDLVGYAFKVPRRRRRPAPRWRP
jgi:hypothetical protein